MTEQELMNTMDRLLEKSKVAILSNIAKDGFPSVRWMSPALIRGRHGYLYAVTSPGFAKTEALEANPKVMWMIQTQALDEILTIKGELRIISNPDLVASVQEAIGGKLATFWKLNGDSSKVVVLETHIQTAEYFKPLAGAKQIVKFTREVVQ